MNPVLFGTHERQLFGIHTPATGTRRRQGVVICPPWGPEYQRAHRACRQLGERMAARGYDVFRFDYYGSGDSGGSAAEVTLAGCVQDTVQAVEELCAIADTRRVLVAGLRLGATIACRASRETAAVDRLVLWDPVCDGLAYLAEIDAMMRGRTLDGQRRAAGGFDMPDRFRAELEVLTPESFDAGRVRRILVVASNQRDEQPLLLDRLRSRAESVDWALHPSPPAWVEEAALGVGAMPVAILDHITAWEI